MSALRTAVLKFLFGETEQGSSTIKAAPPPWLPEVVGQSAESQWIAYDGDGYDQQELVYRKLSWVNTAISKVAQVGAGAEFNVLRLEGEKKVAIPNHPFETLLRKPNPMMSRFEFLEATLTYYDLTGNAYWYLNFAGAALPQELWVIPSNMIRPIPDGYSYLKGYVFDAGHGQTYALEPNEVLHFKRFNPSNLFLGSSPLEGLMDIAVGDLAMQRWNRNLFARDNAKVPGALAFADPVPDAEWNAMRHDIARQHGGVRRSLMMLRNVGKGGVQWISMALGQKEMEFLEGRKANKEEIFNVFAPGLSSILDVNATEANAVTGRRTFLELGVWPILTMIGEKVTNNLLALYGDNVIGEFEDIRPSDRALRIQEQTAAAQVMTVDELRTEFYDLDPIGDERGLLLIAQISPTLTIPIEEPEPEVVEVPAGIASDNGHLVNLSEPETESEEASEAAVTAEKRAFRKWLRNHANRDPSGFKSDLLSQEDRALIVSEAATAAAPFPFYP